MRVWSWAAVAAVVLVAGCTAKSKPTSEAKAEACTKVSEPAPPRQPLPERVMPDPCAYAIEHPPTLAEALASAPGLPTIPSEALRFELRWTEASSSWLERGAKGETTATLTLDPSSARAIEVWTPGEGRPALCQRQVHVELGAHLRTDDGALDSPAQAKLTIWPARLGATVELDAAPKLQGEGVEARLRASVELDGQDGPVRFALEGSKVEQRTRPSGRTVALVGGDLLGATAELPAPADAIPGSLSEAAASRANEQARL